MFHSLHLSLRRSVLRPAFLAVAAAVSLHLPLTAQDAPKEGRQRILPQISVIDKFLSAEQTLGPALGITSRAGWDTQYKDLYTKFQETADAQALGKRRAVLAMALGIKASDGVLALQARDKEALNACADAIIVLAKKLDVPAASLQRAAVIKHHASQGHWIEAFMHLGYLQQAVMSDLERQPERKDDALLIILGGWLQGGRAVTHLILEKYSGPGSNILREPKLVELMIAELNNVRKEYKDDPAVQELIKFMPEVKKRVSVGLRDPIPEADVKWMHAEFTRMVGVVIRGDTAAATPAPAAPAAPATPAAPAATPAPAAPAADK